jgi:hypothetical protein
MNLGRTISTTLEFAFLFAEVEAFPYVFMGCEDLGVTATI